MDASAQFGAWSAFMRRQGLAAGTIRLRRYELRSWDAHVGERWRTRVTWRDVEAWVDARPLGPRARASAVSHLRAFYRWARREGLTRIDPCADVIAPRIPARRPRPARGVVVRRAVGDGSGRVERACALMAYGGLRCCEVARLVWDDVDLVAGVMYVRGKGSRERPVPIPAPLRAVLAGCDGLVGPVVPNAVTGRPVTAQRIGELVRVHLRGIGADVTAHQLRHFAATELGVLAGGDLRVVRDFLGHASIATTEVYSDLIPGALAEAVERWR